MESLKRLVGLTIKDIVKLHDYLQLYLSDGTIVTIYNNYSFKKKSGELFEKKKIVSVSETKDSIDFTIENVGNIIVSLNDEAFNGPEALELSKKNQPTIIWS